MQKPTRLQRFFFFTYAAFLLPSIPHIASFFLAFEGTVQGYALWFWIVVSYTIAIAIDGTLLWLTHTVARDTSHKWGYRAIIWAFILFLVAFSGFLNWHIAKHNAPLASQQLSGSFIPDVDPIVASLFPVLAIMYAVMSRHVFADTKTEKPKTIEELEAEAEIAERKAMAFARIHAASDQQKTSWLQGKIGIVQNALKSGSSESKAQHTDSQDAQNEHEKETETKPIAPPIHPPVEPDLPAPIEAANHQEEPGIEDEQKPQSEQTASRRTMTIEEVVNATGLTERRVKNLIAKKTLKVSSRNANLILISSLDEWLKITPNDKETKELPAIQLASNNNHH